MEQNWREKERLNASLRGNLRRDTVESFDGKRSIITPKPRITTTTKRGDYLISPNAAPSVMLMSLKPKVGSPWMTMGGQKT